MIGEIILTGTSGEARGGVGGRAVPWGTPYTFDSASKPYSCTDTMIQAGQCVVPCESAVEYTTVPQHICMFVCMWGLLLDLVALVPSSLVPISRARSEPIRCALSAQVWRAPCSACLGR